MTPTGGGRGALTIPLALVIALLLLAVPVLAATGATWDTATDWDTGTSNQVDHQIESGTLKLLWNDHYDDGTIGSAWNTTDQDAVASTSFSESGGQLDITAGGADTWTGSDEYGSVYTSYDGNFTAVLKVDSQQNTDPWAKTGIMLRNDMTASTTSTGYAFMVVTPGNGFSFQYDSDGNGYLDMSNSVGTSAYPAWIKLEKSGNTITGYYATTDPFSGGSWTQADSYTFSDANINTVQDVGVSTTSHAGTTLSTTLHDYFLINPNASANHTTAARDLTSSKSLSTLTANVSLPSATSANATVQVSDGNSTWTDAATVTLTDGNNTYDLSGSGRYVRVYSELSTTNQTLTPRIYSYRVEASGGGPTLENFTPTDGSSYVSSTQNLSVDAYSTEKPFDISFYWSDDTLIESVTGINTNGTVEVDPGTLSLGDHSWYVNATDAAGNSTVSGTKSFTVVPQHNVSVTNRTSSRTAAKGSTVQYTIDVKNTGWDDDTYNVTVSNNTDTDFTANVSPETIAVTSGSTGSVTLNVTSPGSGSLPMQTFTTVQATSTNDSSVTDDTTVRTYVGAPDLDNPRRYRLEFGANWSEPYHITNVSWTPRVWLYDQNGDPVSGASVSYSLIDVNDNRQLETSGTATDLGDGSYNFSYTIASWDEGEYQEIEFTVAVNGTTLKEERIYYSDSRDSGYEVPYRFEWDDQTDGPTMLGGANKTINVELHDHTGGLHPGASVSLDVYDDTGSSVHSGTMTDNGDGSYSYTVPDSATTAGNDYHFQVSTSYSSSQTSYYTGYVTSSRYIRAIDTDYNIPSIWDVEVDPFLPTQEDNVSIDAKMSDDAGLSVTRVEYRLNHGPWIYKDLTNTGGSSYTVDLGSFHQEDRIDWKLYAEDTSGNYNETETDIVWISTPTTNASSAKMFLDQDVYMFGQMSNTRTQRDWDGDDVIWPDQSSAPSGSDWEKQIIEKNTIRATALVLDDRGKPKQTIDPGKLNFWITNRNGKKIVINSTTNSEHLKNAGDGRYVAVFQGSEDANGDKVDPMANDIWGKFDSGTSYNVSVSVDGDFIPEDRAPFLAYAYGDAYWQTGNYKMEGDHCEDPGCHGSETYDSDPHQGDTDGLKNMWASDNTWSTQEELPTCGMCHGVKDFTSNSWAPQNARVHPRPYASSYANNSCVNSNCHGQGWDYTTASRPPIDMPVPNYPDGTYNITATYDGVTRTKETYAPDFCSNCHQFPSGIKPPEGGHNDYVGCKFCHQNYHTINDPQKPWDPATDTGTPGYSSSGYENCWDDCHQSVEPHDGTVMCAECHDGMSEQPQHEERMHVKGKGTGTKETSYEFCGHCHQNDTYTYKGITPPQVPDPIQHGDGSSWNSSMGYDSPYWGDPDMACRYCHGRTYNQDPATGRVDDWMGANTIGQTASETTFCSGCHRANYTSGYDDYSDMLHTYNTTTGEIAPEAFGNQTWAPLTDPRYVNMDSYDIEKYNYTDQYCVQCHVTGGTQNTLMKNFVHNVTIDSVPPDVETWILDPVDVTDGTATTVNVTAHVEDPQGIVNESHDPTFNWWINGTNHNGSGTMTKVGSLTWNATIQFSDWGNHTNDVLYYNATDLKDFVNNTGPSADQTELIQPSTNDPPSSPALIYPNPGDSFSTDTITLDWNAATDDGKTPFNITYDLDYTTDGGSNWHDLTDEHSFENTSYDWEVSGVSETSDARFRVRAYDGNGYDGSEYSDYNTSGSFTIDNTPPTISLYRQVPTDLDDTHNGTVEAKFKITDAASGVNTSVKPHLYWRIEDGTDKNYTDQGELTYQGSNIWNGTIPSRDYLTETNNTLQYYIDPIEDTVGNSKTSKTYSDYIDALAGPASFTVVSSRAVVLDDPNTGSTGTGFSNPRNQWGTNYWNGDQTTIRFYAMLKGENGTGVDNQNITFKLLKPDGSTQQTWTVQTNAFGIAEVTKDMNGIDYWGRWTIRAETTYQSTDTSDTHEFILNYWGCANCHDDKDPTGDFESDGQNSPYTKGWGAVVDQKDTHTWHQDMDGFDETKCTHCHQSYGGREGGDRDESLFDDYTVGYHGDDAGVKCTYCHESVDTHRRYQTIPSCYDCHPQNNQNLNPIDTTRSSAVTGVNDDFSVFSWNPGDSGPVVAHTRIYGKSDPDAYNISKGVPCILCHGPMHNITKPDPVGTSNTYTEDSQCDTCHGTLRRVHPTINTSLDYGCVDCHTRKDRHSAHNVSASDTYFTSFTEYNTSAEVDPGWGLWKRWETAYNASYTHDGTDFDSETCESCHAGPNQPRGVHRLNLTYTQATEPKTYFNGTAGTTLNCQTCHGSDTNADGEQDVHSAHPISYGESNDGCLCHDGTLGSLPQSSLTTGEYDVTVFGTTQVYAAYEDQSCTQCHGDWHTSSEFDSSESPGLSRDAGWSVKNDTATWRGTRAPVASNASPGTTGYTNCTVAPCHVDTAHEAMAKSTTADNFPHYTSQNSGKSPGCDECHGKNQWNDHQAGVINTYGNQTDAYPACDTCHFPEPRDRGYDSLPKPGYDY